MSYSTVSSAEVGAASAFFGAGLGYMFAHEKYNLEQLLTQKPDVFEKTFPEKVISKSTNAEKKAISTLVKARKAVSQNTAELVAYLSDVKLQKVYDSLSGILPKARAKTAVIYALVAGAAGVVLNSVFFKNKH